MSKKDKTQKTKILILWLVIGFLGAFAIGGGVILAFSGAANTVFEGDCVDCYSGVGEDFTAGASGTRFPNGVSADSTSPVAGQIRSTTLTTTGAATISGVLTGTSAVFSGDLNGQKSATTTDLVDHTIANTSSNHIEFLKGTGATTTLPTVAEGLVVKFVTAALFGTADWVILSAEGDNIDGTLFVNQAPVACAGEDKISFVFGSDTTSDWLELTGSLLNGTLTWIITGSNFDAAGGGVCTDEA